MKKILIPIDRSELSQQSFSFAKEIAENLKSKLVIVHVIEMIPYSPSYNIVGSGMGKKYMSDEDYLEGETNRLLEKAKSYFDGTGIEVETKILWGSPVDKLLDYSEKEDFDLIIMNTKGMSESKRIVIGSVTNHVVKLATVPVMVVR